MAPRQLSKSRRAALIIHLAYAFIPWPEFWIKNQTKIIDQGAIRATFEAQCKGRAPVYDMAVAMSEASRRHGLSRRAQQLSPREGMIFIFEYPQNAAFWMKETLIPLQLVYVKPDGSVLETMEMPVEKNPEDPKKLYRSSAPINAAIELAPRTLKKAKGLKFCVETKD